MKLRISHTNKAPIDIDDADSIHIRVGSCEYEIRPRVTHLRRHEDGGIIVSHGGLEHLVIEPRASNQVGITTRKR